MQRRAVENRRCAGGEYGACRAVGDLGMLS
jgi:hypothetical protein